VLLVLAVGCSEATELRVSVSSTRVDVDAYDPVCTCERQAPPAAGVCHSFSDVKRGGECSCAKDCVSSLRIERDGAVVATGSSSFLKGDFFGATLVVEGCGANVAVPLPASPPPQPAITSLTRATDAFAFDLAWTSPPPVDLVAVRGGAAALYGSTCYVTPKPSTMRITQGIPAEGLPTVTVTSVHVLPVLEIDSTRVRTFAEIEAPPFH
jgi:hypothetical protein